MISTVNNLIQKYSRFGHWEDKHPVITIPTINKKIKSSQCNNSYFATVPFIHGEFYILLEIIDYNG